MALETYDLATIRSWVSQEFGIDMSIADNKATANARINKAIEWVVNRRKNWPWMEKDTTIRVGEPSTSVSATRYAAGIFSFHQFQVLQTTALLFPIVAREFVDFIGRGDKGLLVESVSGLTLQLKQPYRGDEQRCTITAITIGNPTIVTVSLTTDQGGTAILPLNVVTFGVEITGTSYATPAGTFDGLHSATRINNTQFSIPVDSTGFTLIVLGKVKIAREFVISQGYFELPEDYIRESTAHVDEDTEENTLFYRDPSTFEREIRANRLVTPLKRIFTAVPDPIGLNTKKFIAVYPYLSLIHI